MYSRSLKGSKVNSPTISMTLTIIADENASNVWLDRWKISTKKYVKGPIPKKSVKNLIINTSLQDTIVLKIYLFGALGL